MTNNKNSLSSLPTWFLEFPNSLDMLTSTDESISTIFEYVKNKQGYLVIYKVADAWYEFRHLLKEKDIIEEFSDSNVIDKIVFIVNLKTNKFLEIIKIPEQVSLNEILYKKVISKLKKRK